MSSEPSLEIATACARKAWTRAELRALPSSAQVADAGMLVPGKAGRAVWLAALLGDTGPAAFVNLESSDPGFRVSLPIQELPRGALVVYELGGEALPAHKGGPFRFLVPGHEDECVHVKSLARVELAATRGRDTRPADDEAHRALHAKKKPI
ncbi:MAG: molybdopterin-dependent oxidoreductase [Planctomycetes bacterium]|nr:molybdopterin-dependent oxidoreductase [Planctomycetota bacterium]